MCGVDLQILFPYYFNFLDQIEPDHQLRVRIGKGPHNINEGRARGSRLAEGLRTVVRRLGTITALWATRTVVCFS